MADKESSSEKLNGFLEKNKVWLFSVVGAIVIAVVVFVLVVVCSGKSSEKVLSAVDEITFELTKESSDLSESELSKRREAAMESLKPYLSKSGVGGVRANMLAAELSFQIKDYDSALSYWGDAAKKGIKSYTAPLCFYNMGVCAEEDGNLDVAAENYAKASEYKDFIMKSHAMFSLGRVYEAQKENEKAIEVYTNLVNEKPEDSWAKIAKTRIISLELN